MQPIVTDGVAWSVGLPVTIVNREPCKTAEPIGMSFGLRTRVGSRSYVLDGAAHYRNLANTTEPSMWVGDAALCQVTFTGRLKMRDRKMRHGQKCRRRKLRDWKMRHQTARVENAGLRMHTMTLACHHSTLS